MYRPAEPPTIGQHVASLLWIPARPLSSRPPSHAPSRTVRAVGRSRRSAVKVSGLTTFPRERLSRCNECPQAAHYGTRPRSVSAGTRSRLDCSTTFPRERRSASTVHVDCEVLRMGSTPMSLPAVERTLRRRPGRVGRRPHSASGLVRPAVEKSRVAEPASSSRGSTTPHRARARLRGSVIVRPTPHETDAGRGVGGRTSGAAADCSWRPGRSTTTCGAAASMAAEQVLEPLRHRQVEGMAPPDRRWSALHERTCASREILRTSCSDTRRWAQRRLPARSVPASTRTLWQQRQSQKCVAQTVNTPHARQVHRGLVAAVGQRRQPTRGLARTPKANPAGP